jgi:hypothetical protein
LISLLAGLLTPLPFGIADEIDPWRREVQGFDDRERGEERNLKWTRLWRDRNFVKIGDSRSRIFDLPRSDPEETEKESLTTLPSIMVD